MEKTRYFDLLKAFGHIETVVKSNFFSLHTCVTCSELPSYISTMEVHFKSIYCVNQNVLHLHITVAVMRIEAGCYSLHFVYIQIVFADTHNNTILGLQNTLQTYYS